MAGSLKKDSSKLLYCPPLRPNCMKEINNFKTVSATALRSEHRKKRQPQNPDHPIEILFTQRSLLCAFQQIEMLFRNNPKDMSTNQPLHKYDLESIKKRISIPFYICSMILLFTKTLQRVQTCSVRRFLSIQKLNAVNVV